MPEEPARDTTSRAVDFEQDGIHPIATDHASVDPEAEGTHGEILEPAPSARSRLLDFEHQTKHLSHACGDEDCNHGSLSPRPRMQKGYGSFASNYSFDGPASLRSGRSVNGFGGPFPGGHVDNGHDIGAADDTVTSRLLGNETHQTTKWLANRHGVKGRRMMYVFYYLPITNWIRQYRWRFVRGDLIAALTMASFYIPMSLSYASDLGHVPPIHGLYSFVFNLLVYAILGTCPQMVVGPEAAGSLLTGSVVMEAIKSGHIHDDEGIKQAHVAGMVTGLAGAIILLAGLCRLGFLDGILSRPFLRGFISAIGIRILVGQLIPEMGLDTAAAQSQRASHGSSLDKIIFLIQHGHEAHKLTCIVSFSTVAIVLVLREIKRRLQPRTSWVAYIPDRFVVVVLSAVFAWRFNWESQGLDILGDIRSKGRPFQVHFPFEEHNFKHVDDAFSTAFIIAILGFFESCVAGKALGAPKVKKVVNKDGEEVDEADGIQGMSVSANRELVALGVANLIGGLFMALPAFGGYGRSKVNASTGGKTPMSSVFLSIITIICILFLLPYFYFIPRGVLSAMITVVSISLLEEAPSDIAFFIRIGGWLELALMALIFLATFFWSLRIGIVVGIVLSLLRLLKHASRPRIQILGRVPGTQEFENAELIAEGEEVEMVPHCLIVKIPEPLTFTNTGGLKDRLRRLEDHGTNAAHPALPKVRRDSHNQNIIFDIHGVTDLDPAAAQVLLEIVQGYVVDRRAQVYFCRLPSRRGKVWRLMEKSGIVDLVGGTRHFHRSVDAALKATERESTLRAAAYGTMAGAENESPRGEISMLDGGTMSSAVSADAKGRQRDDGGEAGKGNIGSG